MLHRGITAKEITAKATVTAIATVKPAPAVTVVIVAVMTTDTSAGSTMTMDTSTGSTITTSTTTRWAGGGLVYLTDSDDAVELALECLLAQPKYSPHLIIKDESCRRGEPEPTVKALTPAVTHCKCACLTGRWSKMNKAHLPMCDVAGRWTLPCIVQGIIDYQRAGMGALVAGQLFDSASFRAMGRQITKQRGDIIQKQDEWSHRTIWYIVR
eukprot:COSAG01_NODE_1997_length_8691_cov_5.509777_7_plen_212_part_00